MPYYDEQLKTLQRRISRARQLDGMIRELRRQRDILSVRAHELETVLDQEQADVERLEGRSLAAFFYNVIGKMDQQLTKERGEAYSARVKYDAAIQELEAAEYELAEYEEELALLRGCEKQYQEIFEEKEAAIRESGGATAQEILKLEECWEVLTHQKKELREAINAGDRAFITTKEILESLDSAQNWGTWDLLGGGLLTDIVKHSQLDDAQEAIERLQSQLRRFKTELADVTIQADMQVTIDGFLQFADYFFDGLFADWAVLEKISKSKAQVEQTKAQIETVLLRLDEMLESCDQEQLGIRQKLDGLVRDTEL